MLILERTACQRRPTHARPAFRITAVAAAALAAGCGGGGSGGAAVALPPTAYSIDLASTDASIDSSVGQSVAYVGGAAPKGKLKGWIEASL